MGLKDFIGVLGGFLLVIGFLLGSFLIFDLLWDLSNHTLHLLKIEVSVLISILLLILLDNVLKDEK